MRVQCDDRSDDVHFLLERNRVAHKRIAPRTLRIFLADEHVIGPHAVLVRIGPVLDHVLTSTDNHPAARPLLRIVFADEELLHQHPLV